MPIQFNIKDQNGQESQVDVSALAQQLQAAGTQVQGVSPDGTHLTLVDAQGPYEVSAQDVLKQQGWNVMGVKPLNADYGFVDPGLRAAVSKLPDPMLQQEFLQQHLQTYPTFQKSGQKPQVMGAGRDWFVFNPESAQWIALTNSPDWDLADAAEAGFEAPRLAASVLGGSAGVALGGGTPASALTGAAGAALAGGAVNIGEQSLLGSVYPEFEKVASAHPEEIWKDRAYTAGLDALGGAVPAVPGILRSVASPKVAQVAQNIVGRGPVSSAVKGLGQGMESMGTTVGNAARALDNPTGRALATGFVPGLSDVQMGGFVAQAPSALPRFAAKGMGALGDKMAASETASEMLPGMAGRLRTASQNLLRTRPGASPVSRTEQFAEGVRSGQSTAPMMANPNPEYSSRAPDIYGNLFEGTHKKLQGLLGLSGKNAERRALLNAYKEARASGIRPDEAKGIGQEAVNDLRARTSASQAKWGQRGERAGRYAEQLGRAGQFVERGAENIVGAGIKGARAGAAGARFGGRQLRRLGTLNQPFEAQEAVRIGAEEAYPRRDTLPAMPSYDTMDDGILAYNQ